MGYIPFDTRQSENRAALAAIGSNANTTLDVILSDINTIFADATSSATPSVLMKRDTNANTQVNNLISNLTTTATAAGTTTLTVASSYFQQFTGTTTQTVVLPDATTLVVGQAFFITNRSTGNVTVNANGGGLVQTMGANTQVIVTVTNISASAGIWDSAYSITTALSNPMTTLGDTIYGGVSGVPTQLSGNTTSTINFLSQTGTGSVSAAPVWAQFIAPTVQIFNSGGTYYPSYVFVVSSANATQGATYTNNGFTFTVSQTIVNSTLLTTTTSGVSNIPTASGTLILSSGTGDATITFTSYRNPLYLEIEMVGGGGGGSGSGISASGGTGGTGGASYFINTSTLYASGGVGGNSGGGGGNGGNTITVDGAISSISQCFGGQGSSGGIAGTSGFVVGGSGATSPFGGAGGGGEAPGGGGAAIANSGSGGGGASNVGGNGNYTGGGGGAGAYVRAIILNPIFSSYSCVVGAGGSGGSAGSSGTAGGDGASGRISIKEFYQ